LILYDKSWHLDLRRDGYRHYPITNITSDRTSVGIAMGLYRCFVEITLNSLKFEVYPLFSDDSTPNSQVDRSISVPVKLLVSIATIPTLAAIVGLQAGMQQIQAIANNSEEIFRGDRLPLLPFPEQFQPPN
jgi:hypothetical protein